MDIVTKILKIFTKSNPALYIKKIQHDHMGFNSRRQDCSNIQKSINKFTILKNVLKNYMMILIDEENKSISEISQQTRNERELLNLLKDSNKTQWFTSDIMLSP